MSANNQHSLTLHLTTEQLRRIISEEVRRALQVAGTEKQKNAEEELLSPAQAGKLIGISSKQIIRLVNAGQVSAHRVGKLYRIPRSSVNGYLKVCDLSQFN